MNLTIATIPLIYAHSNFPVLAVGVILGLNRLDTRSQNQSPQNYLQQLFKSSHSHKFKRLIQKQSCRTSFFHCCKQFVAFSMGEPIFRNIKASSITIHLHWKRLYRYICKHTSTFPEFRSRLSGKKNSYQKKEKNSFWKKKKGKKIVFKIWIFFPKSIFSFFFRKSIFFLFFVFFDFFPFFLFFLFFVPVYL